jgi:hypothetical protein
MAKSLQGWRAEERLVARLIRIRRMLREAP